MNLSSLPIQDLQAVFNNRLDKVRSLNLVISRSLPYDEEEQELKKLDVLAPLENAIEVLEAVKLVIERDWKTQNKFRVRVED